MRLFESMPVLIAPVWISRLGNVAAKRCHGYALRVALPHSLGGGHSFLAVQQTAGVIAPAVCCSSIFIELLSSAHA